MTTTTTTSSSTGTLSSLGLGSGLDANGIVSKLVDIERQPITNLQKAADKIQTQISAYGQIQSSVTALRDAARKVTDPSMWSATTATSADSTAVAFTTSQGATQGNYAVQVNKLAASQSVVAATALPSSSATVGSGSLSIQLGTWTDTTFAAASGSSAVSITIDAADSLSAIQDKINGANAGVTASIVKDSTGSRLVMTSNKTGLANGFRIQATDGDGNNTDNAGLSTLAYDPENTTTGTTLTQPASDSSVKVNGIDVSSSTNTFDSVLNGISFTVGKVTTSAVNVTVAQDNTTITKAITDFASAYSALSTLLHTDTKYDDSTKTAGTLQADASAVGIMNQFRSVIGGSTTASSTFGTLSSIGLEMQTDGTVSVNNTKLTSALAKLGEVKKLFSAAGTTAGGDDGIATRLRALGDNLLSFDGSLASRTAGLNTKLQNNQKRQDELDARVTLYQTRLKAQYTALDTTMSAISAQSNYVTQMVTAWSKSS